MTRHDIEPLRPDRAGFSRLDDAERTRIGRVLAGMQQNDAIRPDTRGSDPLLPSGPPRRRRVGVLALIALASAGIALWGFQPARHALGSAAAGLPLVGADAPVASAPLPVGPTVPAVNAAAGSTAAATPAASAPQGPVVVLQASGTLVAKRMATVSASVTGRLAEILVAEGDTVTAEQPIARLDTELAERAIRSAEARVKAAESAAAVSAARETAGAAILERVREMADRGLVPRQKLTDQANEYAVVRAEVAAQSEQIEVERQQVSLARQEIDDAVIRAPFGGVVTELNASVGEVVSPLSTGGFTRSGVGTIVDLSSLVAEIDISEQYLSRIHVGQKAELTTPAFPDRKLIGTIMLISPRVDPATAAVTISVRFDRKEDGVFPGMRVDASFLDRDPSKSEEKEAS